MAEAAESLRQLAQHVYQVGELPRRDGEMQNIEPVGLTVHPAHALRDLAIEHRVVRTIETGLGLGLSALSFGQAILQSADRDALHTSIDPYPHRTGYAGLDLIQNSALAPYFRFLHAPSQLALPRLVEAGELFDMALVDGGHFFDSALMDIYYTMTLVREGGLVVVDDVWMPAVRTAIEYAARNLNCKLLCTPHKRFAVLARPSKFPPDRIWDTFTPFEDPGIERFEAQSCARA